MGIMMYSIVVPILQMRNGDIKKLSDFSQN